MPPKSACRFSTAAPMQASGLRWVSGVEVSQLAILFLQIDKHCSLPDSGLDVKLNFQTRITVLAPPGFGKAIASHWAGREVLSGCARPF